LDEFDKSDSYLFLSKKLKGKEKKEREERQKKCMEASKGGINNTGGEIFF
jgi:hypothetical protein